MASSVLVSKSEGSSVSDLMEDVSEYFLNGVWEGEDVGGLEKDEKVISCSFHIGVPCGFVSSEAREDVDVKKLLNFFC